MKKWICHNLFGEHPDDVDTCGMIGGLCVLAFLIFGSCYLFIYIPFYCIG